MLFCSALTLSTAAYCSNASNGKVVGISSGPSGIIVFEQLGERGARPSCAAQGVKSRWALDTSTSAGTIMLDNLLEAQAKRSLVSIVGSGACSADASFETVLQIILP
jgi:hypothetical protein